jgi:hypothetical protein
MTRLAASIAALALLVAAPTLAQATEYPAITTGPSQPSKPSARSFTNGPRVPVTTGPWIPSKSSVRTTTKSVRVVITTGPSVPSKPTARLAIRAD